MIKMIFVGILYRKIPVFTEGRAFKKQLRTVFSDGASRRVGVFVGYHLFNLRSFS